MTRITVKQSEFGTNHLQVNGRLVAVNGRISKISAVSNSRFEGEASGEKFVIFGGNASGGAANEWHVQWDAHGDHVFNVKSAIEACNIIEKA